MANEPICDLHGEPMKLAALCCTYLRPAGLGQLIESFLRQDYPSELREMIILDDAGHYENQSGDGWRLVSIPYRFNSLGEKRNACAALASPDVEGFLIADDDDIYLPHWFQTQAEALRRADWSRPSLVLLEHQEGLREVETGGLYHGGWAFRKLAFQKVRGYGPHNNGEDQELAARLQGAGATICDPSSFAKPFYIYRYENNSYHLSHMDDSGYRHLGRGSSPSCDSLSVGWERPWDTLPVLRKFVFAPHVNPCNEKSAVELIGSIDSPGGNGPSNGMFALQQQLRKRISSGLEWLTIKSLPASEGSLPWFWHWDDRSYANWWNEQGKPFLIGPNVLFLNSGNPRCDKLESGILDAENCKAFFCHTPWYRDLIAKHQGPSSSASIELWPYPISPLPSGPQNAKYDLLIYAKNGHRPGLLEFLANMFRSHVQIHYGKFKREELADAASKSRACVYLADDDHGPLALQEILLSGCPVVGVSTGASFVKDGVTGVMVDKMPSSPEFHLSYDDSQFLIRYLSAIGLAMTLDRQAIREFALNQFDENAITDKIIECLQAIRKSI